MNIVIIFVDNLSADISYQLVIDKYRERLKHYCQLEIITITVPKNVRQKSIEEQKRDEEKLIQKQLKDNDLVILLDEKGEEMNSVNFSKWMSKQIGRYKRILFITGGPYGFSDDLKDRYFKLSLSKMTFSHELVRIIFLEQLYRSFTIIKGQKYHHE